MSGPVPKVLPPGEHVYFNDTAIEDPAARSAIMRVYERWYAGAEPHLRVDDQEAKRFLFQVLTQNLRPIIDIPAHLSVIGVRGFGFKAGPAQNHREVWFTVGIIEKVREQLVKLASVKEMPRGLGNVQSDLFRAGIAERNKEEGEKA